jgi:cytochrome c peroxidase
MRWWLAGSLGIVAILAATLRFSGDARPDPASVRAAALAAGLGSLARVAVPTPSNLFEFVRDTPDGRAAIRQLGKALFWDMQVGSDGQACASCHFHAGADNRVKNQLNPGELANDTTYGNVGAGLSAPTGHPSFGANYAFKPEDFPFHVVEIYGAVDFSRRTVLRDTNDIASSQGVFNATFTALLPGEGVESGAHKPDPVFNVAGANVRRVATRNTPSVINAVFNVDNFWDGRAKSDFNGSSAVGLADVEAGVFEQDAAGSALVKRKVRIDHASLASQSLSPPLSHTEMSFAGRTFPQLGRKMLARRPLELQLVSPEDSVLGPLSRARLSENRVTGERGLSMSYDALIRRAFQPRWWNSSSRTDGYTQMEANFSLFFGLAIQAYESLLVSDGSAFDRFMEGEDASLTETQLRGLLAFIKTPFSKGSRFRAPFSFADVFRDVGRGSCALCHAGPEFTAAAYTTTIKRGRIGLFTTAELVEGRLAEQRSVRAYADQGFFNIGVRPTQEDFGRGASTGQPLSLTRAAAAGLTFAPSLPPCGGSRTAPCPIANRDLVSGAFKIPSLRNVELTGPYFHNGGQATLKQVVEFYRRQGDFGDLNAANVGPFLALVELNADDGDRIIDFLRSLTDERVRLERAPFDHPQLLVPDGSPGDSIGLRCKVGTAPCDNHVDLPAVGARGRPAAGLPALTHFLGLDPQWTSGPKRCP